MTPVTDGLMSIGTFSRASGLSIKALRAYHEGAILVPARVDPVTGYRSYHAGQITDAAVIQRLRSLDVPLDRVREVVHARDPEVTRRVLAGHAAAMQARLDDVTRIVGELQEGLELPGAHTPVHVRDEPAAHTLALQGEVTPSDFATFLGEAHARLRGMAERAGAAPTGPFGALYPPEVADDAATVFIQDYQLQLVPRMLRDLRPDLKIGFFLHIPFPPVELFAQLPWRRQILEGLLGADLVGFQRLGAEPAKRQRLEHRLGLCDERAPARFLAKHALGHEPVEVLHGGLRVRVVGCVVVPQEPDQPLQLADRLAARLLHGGQRVAERCLLRAVRAVPVGQMVQVPLEDLLLREGLLDLPRHRPDVLPLARGERGEGRDHPAAAAAWRLGRASGRRRAGRVDCGRRQR